MPVITRRVADENSVGALVDLLFIRILPLSRTAYKNTECWFGIYIYIAYKYKKDYMIAMSLLALCLAIPGNKSP